MSMRGQVISKEYKRMEWVQDKDGKEFVCYRDDLQDFDSSKGLTDQQKSRCLDTSEIAGDSW